MVGFNPKGLFFESEFHVGNYLQAWQGSPLGRRVTSKPHNMDVSSICLVLPPVHLSGSITSTLTRIKVEALLPLDIESESKNEKLIWLSPRVAWRTLLHVNIKKHSESSFWSLRRKYL